MKLFSSINTDRLFLRQLNIDDGSSIYGLQSSRVNQKYIDRPIMDDIDQAVAFIEKINDGIDAGEWVYWAICLKPADDLIGTVCLWNFSENNKDAELGYELNEKYQGEGYMDEAVKAVINYGFNNLGLHSIEAYTNKLNLPSVKLLERNGFSIKKSILEKCHFKKGEINMSVYVLNKSVN